MPATLKKIALLSLALVLSATPVALAGCEGMTQEVMTQEEIDQVVADAIAAEYDSVKFDVEAPMTLEVVGGSNPSTMTAAVDSTGVVDATNEAIQMTMNMTMSVVGEGEEDITSEIYIADGWMYNMMSVAGAAGEWLKMAVTGENWQQQSPVEQQIELLRTAVAINFLGSQKIDGVPCYVFELEPDMETFSALLAQETSGIGFMDFSEVALSDLYKELSVKQWLAQDGYQLMKVEIEVLLEITADDVNSEDYDFDSMTVEMSMAVTFYDYDQPVDITVPPEALEAEEVSYS